ncbi:uncharacterized protein LOC133290205 [Gastrolobium bilobum]|uniref:uncharacterized protein LOC133290205 n=1 Tax=Gastrolobium bilobum TaxID=150636 RepID=UPI002AB22E57|nr:uncharacterized protein LOC133290205 [Gastrolobium bilobum]
MDRRSITQHLTTKGEEQGGAQLEGLSQLSSCTKVMLKPNQLRNGAKLKYIDAIFDYDSPASDDDDSPESDDDDSPESDDDDSPESDDDDSLESDDDDSPESDDDDSPESDDDDSPASDDDDSPASDDDDSLRPMRPKLHINNNKKSESTK